MGQWAGGKITPWKTTTAQWQQFKCPPWDRAINRFLPSNILCSLFLFLFFKLSAPFVAPYHNTLRSFMHIMHHSFKFETKTSFVLFWKAGLNESLLWRKSSHYQYHSVVLTNSVYQAEETNKSIICVSYTTSENILSIVQSI